MIEGIGNPSSPTVAQAAPVKRPAPQPVMGPVVTMVRSPIDPGPAYRVEISMQGRARAGMG